MKGKNDGRNRTRVSAEKKRRAKVASVALKATKKSLTGYFTGAYYFEPKGVDFSDAIAVYLLSLYLDLDYQELREREYPLLAPAALAERLRKVAELFPPNPGFEFSVLYKRRT